MSAKLTVIIPLYNQEQYIEECINSVLSQSYIDICVIIVDDGSTDESLKICNRMAEKDNRITVLSQANQGSFAARLRGLLETKTQYVTFIDSDDFILKDSYIYAYEAMNKDVDLIFFEITRYFDKNNMKQEFHTIKEGFYGKEQIEQELFPKLIWNFERNTPGIDCSLCSRIVKTQILLDEYLRFDGQNLYYGDDAAIAYPLFTQINSMEVISKSYYMHRQRNSTLPPYIMSDFFFDEAKNLFDYLTKRLVNYLDKYDLKKQIEYFYIYSVELKKKVYNDYEFHRDFLFPFDKVPCGKKVILYGAGEVGRAYHKQLESLNYCEELLWIDKRADTISDDRVKNISELQNSKYDFVVVAIENGKVCIQVKEDLIQQGCESKKIIY